MMKTSNLVFAAICVLLSFADCSFAKAWRGILPLLSTRSDVERQFGQPNLKLGNNIYDVENERAIISYSEGQCEKGWNYGWNVPPDTVTGISIYLQSTVTLDDLKLNLGDFEKVQDPHVDGIIYYDNRNEGFTVEVNKYEGHVRGFSYYPAAKDEHLACPRQPTGLPEGRGVADSLLMLNQYGDIPFAEEQERLDILGLELKHSSDTEGYIIVYAGKRAHIGEAQARAKRAKEYIVKKYGIDTKRIWAIDGGYQEKKTVELYILPLGGVIPLVMPTIRPSQVEIIDKRKISPRTRTPGK